MAKYKVAFKIHGETDGHVPKHGVMVITLNEDCESKKSLEQELSTFISDVFNINENRVGIIKIAVVKK